MTRPGSWIRSRLPWTVLIAFLTASPAVARQVDDPRPGSDDAINASLVGEVIEWPAYGRDPGGTRFSPARAIDRTNVADLEIAWTARTGHLEMGPPGKIEATPIVVDGTLYLSTPHGLALALDSTTGAEVWRFDAEIDQGGDYGDFASRGVSTWLDPDRPDGPCTRRIFLPTIDGRLFALDGTTGRPCADFGESGVVDLTAELRNPPEFVGEVQVTSPPAVIGDVVVVGSAIADNRRVDAPAGVVQARDARTGALRWRWDPVPRDPADPAAGAWGAEGRRTGAANVWAPIAADPERDLVFLPTSSPSPDFYGGERPGDNRYANSVVALRGSTGEVVWAFQTVHHDLWDYDVPAQPVLVTLERDGREVPALVQVTKTGNVFVLDRETGEPVFGIEERSVPVSDVDGEASSTTQPFPLRPPPVVPQALLTEDAWGIDEADRAFCREWMETLRTGEIFTPPSLEGTAVFPGNVGGSHWGGASVDPVRKILVTPTNRLATAIRVVPRAGVEAAREPGVEVGRQAGTPYGMARKFMLTDRQIPCTPPPWGALVAIDLTRGEILWETPLGHLPGMEDVPGALEWGSPNLGGALVTGGGLVFVAATLDERLRAFDVETGRELWSAPLPAGGNATPMTYVAKDGRQYLVIVAGGHEDLGTTAGDYVVAFGLPDGTPGEDPGRLPPETED